MGHTSPPLPPPPPGYPAPPPGYAPRRFYGPPPKGPFGGLDPMMFLLFQNGGLGGNGGHPGKGGLGGMNPLLLSSLLGGCKEPVSDCTPPNKADGTLCGVNSADHKPC